MTPEDGSIVKRLFAIQAEYERDEAENEDAPLPAPGPPAITFDMAGEHIGFRDQAALDEYVMGALDAEPCPQGIHGWRQRTPNNLCPWCEWEDDRQRLGAVTQASAADGPDVAALVGLVLEAHQQGFRDHKAPFYCTGCDWVAVVVGDGRDAAGVTIEQQHRTHLAAVLADRLAAVTEQRDQYAAQAWDEGHEGCEWPRCATKHRNPYRAALRADGGGGR